MGVLRIIQVDVLIYRSRNRDRQRFLRQRDDGAGSADRLRIRTGRNVVVRRQVQSRHCQLRIIVVDEDVGTACVEEMRRAEGRRDTASLDLVSFGNRVGSQEALFIDVDREDEPIAGIETREVQDHQRSAVADGDVNGIDSRLIDD